MAAITHIASKFGAALLLLFMTALFVQVSPAQTGVDLSFNGVPTRPLLPTDGTATSVQQAVQADGKILVWGGAIAADGVAKGRIVRLNADGRVDTSFSYCHCELTVLNNLMPLADGKILVAGSSVAGWMVIRLNNDGSLDPTFYFAPASNGPNSSATLAAVDDDGKFYVSRFRSFQGESAVDLSKFNENGSQDATFSNILIGYGSPNYSVLGALELLPDGRIYVAVNTTFSFTSTRLQRYTSAGSVDPTWEAPSFGSGPSFPSYIAQLAVQPDGGLLVSGDFVAVNGTPKVDIVRLLPAGNVDLNFSGPAFLRSSGVEVLPNGKILYSAVTAVGGDNRIFRLNPDGSQDGTFVMDPAVANIRNAWDVDTQERIVFAGDTQPFRLLADGGLDTSFAPNLGQFGRVYTLARQSDGRVIVAGEFTGFNGVATISLVRTNADGTLDATFDAGTGFNAIPTRIVVQPDNKLVVVGPFNSFNGVTVPGIVRLLPDGALDTTFTAAPNTGSEIWWVDPLPDGRFYISGNFSTIGSVSRPGVARLNNNGSLDGEFNALIGGSPNISAVAVQPDGKVLIGGSFTGVGGFNRSNFVRLDSTGTLDQTFNPTNTTAGRIHPMPDGKTFTTSAGQGDTLTILRRNPDGTTDSSFVSIGFRHSFSSGTTRLHALLPQTDGSVIVAGSFNRVGSAERTGIVRLAPNGTLDPLFLPRAADGPVRSVIPAGDGKVMAGGDFGLIGNAAKAGLARLNVAPFRKVTLFDFDGDGRADFTVFRPSTNKWYILRTSDWQYTEVNFGSTGDIVAPADFDGDGKTDLGIYRSSGGNWWYAASASGGTHRTIQHGYAGDIPRPADFDGDGSADFVVYRPSEGRWHRLDSLGNYSSFAFGALGDMPVRGDFDGDGKADYAVYRPSTGVWWYAASGSGNAHRAQQWGASDDIPVPADYDGDGKTDFAVYRPAEGGWYILNSSNGSFVTTAFGLSTDRPIAADYDGDGRADIAVFRPSTGVWYLSQSTAGFGGVQWGVATDTPAPSAFLP